MSKDSATVTVFSVQHRTSVEAWERQQRGTRQLFLAKCFFFAFAYVIAAILARKLGAVEYGIYGVVISVLLWLEILGNAGVPGATAKLIADRRYDPEDVERSGRALLISLSVLLVIVCWFLAPQVANLMRVSNGEALFRIAVVDLPFAALYASYEGVLYGRCRFGVIAAAQVLYTATKLTGIIALVGVGFSVERVLVINVLATCIVCLALTLGFPPRGFKPMRATIAQIGGIAAPMALYLIASQVLINLDLWSLASLWKGDAEVVGQYVASMNLAKILCLIPAAQAGVLFSSIAWALASRDASRAQLHIHEASRFALIIAAGTVTLLGIDGSEVLSTLFSKAYAEGHRVLPLQLAGFGVFALLDIFSHSLMAVGRRSFAAGTIVATVPLVWLSNYFLIPRFGPLGAATSLLLGMAAAACVTGSMAYRYFGSVIRLSTVMRVLIAIVSVGLVSKAITVQGPWIVLKLGMLSSLYLVVLFMLGEITTKDFAFAKKQTGDGFAAQLPEG
ncbi:MAG TPA: oligosaccharide flippase family protein [Candidatus Binatia bacterium]|nr:oligosaccharide flippase family protein [Candidatus Binatia bacterium]